MLREIIWVRVNSSKQVMAARSQALTLHSCVMLMHTHARTATLISICPMTSFWVDVMLPSQWWSYTTICRKRTCDVTFTRKWGIFRKLSQPIRNAITRLILGFGHRDASQWWLNVYLHRLCTKLKRIYLVLGHIVYVCDIVCRICRCLCGFVIFCTLSWALYLDYSGM